MYKEILRSAQNDSGVFAEFGFMNQRSYAIYILMNKMKTDSYIGVTNNLIGRIWEHKNKINDGFTKRYNVDRLVYFEIYDSPSAAINREKQIKGWLKKKKLQLIETLNPYYLDLWEQIIK